MKHSYVHGKERNSVNKATDYGQVCISVGKMFVKRIGMRWRLANSLPFELGQG